MRVLPFDYAIRNLGRRPLRTLLTGGACALVAAALVATSAFVRGLEKSFADAGRPDVAILLSAVSQRDVIRSTVAPAVAELVVADVPGISRVGGVPAVSGEIHMGTNVHLGEAPAGGADPAYAGFVRGVTPRAFLVHDAVTLIEGAPPQTGEVIAGRLAASKLGVDEAALAVGRTVRFEGAAFRVAGRFAAPGTTIESEIWTPVNELKGLVRRDDVSAVFVKVDDPAVLDDLAVFAKRRLDLELICIPSQLYYKELAGYFQPIRGLAWVMAFLIAGAVIATGANTLNTAVQDRMRELATLRAMGYGGLALARSLLQEASVLAAGGGLVGLIVARLLVSGAAFRIGMGAFSLTVGAPSILAGFAGVVALGLLGTIPAAIRVIRMPVAAALKES
jgi:ABC-type lipoprotein release transport system permease subunit